MAAAALWGVLGPFSRLAFSEGVQPMEVAFWRALLAWGFFAIHAVATRSLRMAPKDLPMVVLFAVTGVTLFYGSYQLAIQRGGAAMASVLLYTAPAWVAAIARFTFREPLTRSKIAALTLTIAGVAGVAWSGGSIEFSGAAVLFGLTAGFCYSLYYIFGKYFSSRYSSSNLFFYMLPIGAVTLYPWVTFSTKTPTAWAALIIIATVCTYGAYFCYYRGVRYLEASRSAITATLEPVIASAVAYFWWKETFGATGYIGSALILGAIVIMVLDKR